MSKKSQKRWWEYKIVYSLWNRDWQLLKMLKHSYRTQQLHPRYIAKRNENIRPYKNAHINVHSGVTHNIQKEETAPMSHQLAAG